MKQISFIFCLLIIGLLQASDLPIDSLHNPAFHRKINFYLKYSTHSEAQQVVRKLQQMEQVATTQRTRIDDSLSQEVYNYADAYNRSQQFITTIPDLYQAHEDKGIALWNYQCSNYNKHLVENDLMHIATLKQMMGMRKDRLKLRADKRALTIEQELFNEQKMQLKRDQSIQKSRVAQDEKNRSMLARKLAHSQERRQQKEQNDQELKTLQELAIQKGIKPTLLPTESERLAQSERDKELAAQKICQVKNYGESLSLACIKKQENFIKKASATPKPKKHHTNIIAKNTCNKTIEYDPLESVNHAFQSFLHILRPQKDIDNQLIFTKSNTTRIEKAMQNLQTKITIDNQLFHTHKTTPRTSKCLQDLDELLHTYQAAREESENQIKEFHETAQAKLQGQFTSVADRFWYYRSQEFQQKYKKLEALACNSRKKDEQAKAEFIILRKELKECDDDKALFEKYGELESITNAIKNLQISINKQTSSIKANDKYNNKEPKEKKSHNDDDDDHGFMLPTCIIM